MWTMIETMENPLLDNGKPIARRTPMEFEDHYTFHFLTLFQIALAASTTVSRR